MNVVDILDTKLGLEYPKHILLETLDDWLEFKTLAFNDLNRAQYTVMKSTIPKSRWDHIRMRGFGGSAFTAAVMKMNIDGSNALLHSIQVLEETTDAKRQLIERGERVAINRNGGYFYLMPHHEITHSQPYDAGAERAALVHIRKNTTLLNLENDPELEQCVIDYMTEVDPNFSYILDLRGWESGQLLSHFKTFVERGGQSLYVYTTGFDHLQVDQYLTLAKKAGIGRAVIKLNSGMPEQLEPILQRHRELMDVVWTS